MEKEAIIENDKLVYAIYDVTKMGLNFDSILHQAKINSNYVFDVILSNYSTMNINNKLLNYNPCVELKTEPTHYGCTLLEEIADTVNLDLNNDIRTLLEVNEKEVKPIFFSVKSLMELGEKFNLSFHLFNGSEKIISNIETSKKLVRKHN